MKRKALLIKQINQAPEPLWSYIHDLETAQCSELVEENHALSENLEGVRRLNAMLKDQVLDLYQVIQKLKRSRAAWKGQHTRIKRKRRNA